MISFYNNAEKEVDASTSFFVVGANFKNKPFKTLSKTNLLQKRIKSL